MARFFSSIGEQIKDFLDSDTYSLQRTAKLNVKDTDRVKWSLENTLNGEGKVESTLSVTHKFDRETLKLKTSNVKNPKFTVNSKRFDKYFVTEMSVKDPKLELELNHKKEKYSVKSESSYNWNTHQCKGSLEFAYVGLDKWVLGAMAELDRPGRNDPIAPSDYGIGVEFQRNQDQTFSFTTEDRLNSLVAGAQFKVRDGYTGYGRVSFDRSKNDNAVGWAVGVDHKLNDNQSLAAVYRSNQEASFQYSNTNKDQNWDAKVACNADFNKDAANRYTLEWEIVFG